MNWANYSLIKITCFLVIPVVSAYHIFELISNSDLNSTAISAISTTMLTTLITSTEESSTLTTLSNSTTQITTAMSETTRNEFINLDPIRYVEVYPAMIPLTATPTTSTTEWTDKMTVTDPFLVPISSPTKFDAKTAELLSLGFK